MLTPEQLTALADALLPVYERYQTSLIDDMARRIARIGVTDASTWQMAKYQEAGGVYSDAIGHLARQTGITQHELRKLFEQAGAQAVAYDNKVYTAAGLMPNPLRQSPAALQALNAGLQKTQGLLENWTMTTAVTSQQAFIGAVDMAYMQVTGGGMSMQQAVKNAVTKLAGDGLYVLYPSGHRDKIDVAARRAVVTGVNQTCAGISLATAEEMGCDHVEVTAHFGARPTHSVWQGRVYQLSTGEFEQATGYGEGSGLCGWNCRHSFFPYLEGVSQRTYTDDDLRAMEEATVRVGDEDIPLYEATQRQRRMEREIRATKRELSAMQAAMEEIPGLRDAYSAGAAKLKRQRDALAAFEGETGLRNQAARTQVAGFGHSQASTASWAVRKVETAKEEGLGALVGATNVTGLRISGITKHFEDRARERNVTASSVLSALQSPLQVGKLRIDRYGAKSQTFIGEKATVVMNPDVGTLITTYPTKSRILEKLRKRKEGV